MLQRLPQSMRTAFCLTSQTKKNKICWDLPLTLIQRHQTTNLILQRLELPTRRKGLALRYRNFQLRLTGVKKEWFKLLKIKESVDPLGHLPLLQQQKVHTLYKLELCFLYQNNNLLIAQALLEITHALVVTRAIHGAMQNKIQLNLNLFTLTFLELLKKLVIVLAQLQTDRSQSVFRLIYLILLIL